MPEVKDHDALQKNSHLVWELSWLQLQKSHTREIPGSPDVERLGNDIFSEQQYPTLPENAYSEGLPIDMKAHSFVFTCIQEWQTQAQFLEHPGIYWIPLMFLNSYLSWKCCTTRLVTATPLQMHIQSHVCWLSLHTCKRTKEYEHMAKWCCTVNHSASCSSGPLALQVRNLAAF